MPKKISADFLLEDVKIMGGTDEEFKNLQSIKDDDEEIVFDTKNSKFDKKEISKGIMDILKEFGGKGGNLKKMAMAESDDDEEESSEEEVKPEKPKKLSKKDLASVK